MSPTKQAKSQGNSGKEPKLHQVTEWRKKPWEKSGASSPLANERTVYDYYSGGITSQKSDWIRTFRILSSSIWINSLVVSNQLHFEMVTGLLRCYIVSF